MASMDVEAVREAYDEVRNDASETSWVFLNYDDQTIKVAAQGSEYSEFQNLFTDDERAFGFVRVVSGDEMSKRAKFVLITWCGNQVSPLKRARMSTDKIEVKRVIKSFSIELQVSDPEEVELSCVMAQVQKAGGANYGTGAPN
ncbi:hypothetical protein CAPTEDRAFT_159358 [Capitella teleta]|uniref:Coactosin-like protein n=1 Tax=Capitella teleta TaxID=283909 RepID=R7UI21_CAPTE|nr:hypothetical protein CAPTEDRAFT_159358 [Capitella teleta]|eukprot:ELU05865.1 hypothetical protein CAPTEDRAFT_159358 [Capitella teleta]